MGDNTNNKEGIDLSNALDDSDAQFQVEPQQSAQAFDSETPKIFQWVIKHSAGMVNNKRQVKYVILGFIILAIIISFFVVFKRSPGNLSPEEKAFLDQKKSTESYDTKLFSQ